MQTETKSAKVKKDLYERIRPEVYKATGVFPSIGEFINQAIQEKLDSLKTKTKSK
ncbi:MAG: hypothetical protein KDK54_19585 [Leptospiraceae bacterium]|nr:hypothetical protein [Leptospiraceae bacterium]